MFNGSSDGFKWFRQFIKILSKLQKYQDFINYINHEKVKTLMCIKELSGLLINRIFIINSSISLLVVNVDVGVKVIEDNNRE